jgi:tRNA (cmo5U34)-methyltransferase
VPEYRWNDVDKAAGYDAGAEWVHPHYLEIQNRLLEAVPFDRDASIRAVDLGGGSGRLAARFLEAFPGASIDVVDQSEPFLVLARGRLKRFSGRGRCVAARLQEDWESRLVGPIHLFLSMSAIHHLEGPEKRELYRRCAERLEPGGVLLNGDEVRPVDDANYRELLERWWTHMRETIDAGRVSPPMADALQQWKARNLDRFTEPRTCGDDCHETAESQLATFREVGFDRADVVWQRDLWGILRGIRQ